MPTEAEPHKNSFSIPDSFMLRLDQLCAGREAEIVYLNIYNVTPINGCLEVLCAPIVDVDLMWDCTQDAPSILVNA